MNQPARAMTCKETKIARSSIGLAERGDATIAGVREIYRHDNKSKMAKYLWGYICITFMHVD